MTNKQREKAKLVAEILTLTVIQILFAGLSMWQLDTIAQTIRRFKAPQCRDKSAGCCSAWRYFAKSIFPHKNNLKLGQSWLERFTVKFLTWCHRIRKTKTHSQRNGLGSRDFRLVHGLQNIDLKCLQTSFLFPPPPCLPLLRLPALAAVDFKWSMTREKERRKVVAMAENEEQWELAGGWDLKDCRTVSQVENTRRIQTWTEQY